MARQEPADIAATFARASLLHQQGKLKEAAPLYLRVLSREPAHFEAQHMLGLLHAQQGRLIEAVKAIGHALKINPRSEPALSNFGNVLKALGQHREALASYDAALSENPNAPVIWFNRGLLLSDMRRFAEAAASHDRALALAPDYPQALLGRAAALRDLGRLEEALAGCDAAIALQPQLVEAFHLRGVLQWRMNRLDAALDSYNSALAIAPGDAEALNNRGLALAALERPQEALKSYDAALALRPKYVEALNNRGNALAALQRFDQALGSFDKAIALAPDYIAACNNKGAVLAALQRFDEALACYAEVKKRDPANANAHYNSAVALAHLQRFSEALAGFDAALAANPRHPYALSGAANAARNLCDWTRTAALEQEIARAVAEKSVVIAPFTLLGYSDDAVLQLQCAQTYLRDKGAECSGSWRGAVARGHDRLRFAYVSSDFGAHPVGYQIAGLLERHDRTRFEVHGISLGPDDGSAIRARLVKACDHFHDLRPTSDREAARLLRQLEIDIALDLNGHTRDARPGLFAARAAPVQVNYLGYPATTGSSCLDYVIGDAIALPFDQQPFYAEAIVHLPGSFFAPALSSPLPAPPKRGDAGLPEEGVVLCCFGQRWKIIAPLFDVWMRLLREVPGSVLWLSDGPADIRARLEQEAQARGISPDRLAWAPRVTRDEHLARLQLADLVLDTLPYNGHATTAEALACGVPVLSCKGRAFAGRVAASLLTAAGLPELATQTLAQYESRALELARDPAALASLRQKLARNHSDAALFDADRHRRDIEAAYERMWQRAERGERPESFAVREG
jgi:predicted O-linked N-acetylglucosamine transferase (SPINDLY family)